ncbi:MAG: alanine--tRNA ligase [Candidatus Pacebacteria bacterium]|nr:alanine--tRNA ligase [Candidatus Paceibacterota bacterium]
MSTTNEIRSTFLNYFIGLDHQSVPSSPLVPRNDPTLMFTNSGMVQFKNVFTGVEKRDYRRATTAQKSVRAGGKHNDLENVGFTARHHTFFEMLGNFSFGDYFKENAIEYAWTLLTREYGLPADKLLVTVYADDDDAAKLWRKIANIPDSRIIRINTNDNFWSMGDTGPCGPCSEIFFDHGEGIAGGPPGSPEQDGDRFIEIWNLVFMQFEQAADGTRAPLPRPSIDTGMGLERIAAVLQGVHDNYDIDLFRNLITASSEAARVASDGKFKTSHRVIADHLRASGFLIADGVLPANEGRGYVLRRIMRRAMRHAHRMGSTEPLMYRLVPALVREMGAAYPELIAAEALITETLKLEESRFKALLERGLKLLDEETQKLGSGEGLSGAVAFTLYDTYGFPLDLTQDVLRSEGRIVDVAGFEAAMLEQKQRARKAWAGSGEAATESLWFDLKDQLGSTEFLGYDTETAEGKILGLVCDGKVLHSVAATGLASAEVTVIVNQTPFYGESGGQMGDAGVIKTESGAVITITDCQKKLGSLFIHLGRLEGGKITVGDSVTLTVDHERRSRLRANHSATHLLHEALRRQLGTHVGQKGSLVAPERLRFDISHPKPLHQQEIAAVEAEVNRRIRGNSAVSTMLMTPEAAIKTGAMALFGEKYGEEVRVVSMGTDSEPHYSTELCGGTHVARTGDIGLFKIIAEQAVASGVRRIEAQTGISALSEFSRLNGLVAEITGLLKVSEGQIIERLTHLVEDHKKLEKKLIEARKAAAGGGAAASDQATITVNGINYIGRRVDNIPARELKGLVDQLKQQIGSGVVAVVGIDEENRASIVVGVTADLTGRISAVDLVKLGATALGGSGGGGRPDLAQAGGPNGAAAKALLDQGFPAELARV